jgi:GntR family transcriptional regulator
MTTAQTSTPSIPRYKQLAEIIRNAIEQGKLADNQALFSERELAETYAVSRETIRKTLRFLEERGVVYSDHGRGTFVTPSIVRQMSRYIDSFTQNTENRGGKPGQKILAMETVPASMAIASLLSIASGEPVWRVRRVRLIDDIPVGLNDGYYPLPRDIKLEQAELEQTKSLYKLLSEKCGFAPAEAVENLQAGLADDSEAQLLGVSPGAPLLICERITLSDRREPIEYCLMKYVSTYRYTTRVARYGSGD